MDKREKVIKGLEYCAEKQDTIVNKNHGFNCIQCPYFKKCDNTGALVGLPLMRDALELLKAQEPRLIELDEFENVLGRDVPLYFEQRDDISGWDIYSGLEKGTMDIITSAQWAEDQTWQREYYGKEWRCWTARPTDEQREKVKWDENPCSM